MILFVGDAGGLPTLSAAAIEVGRPQKLFLQRMPWIGLSDTSSAEALGDRLRRRDDRNRHRREDP